VNCWLCDAFRVAVLGLMALCLGELSGFAWSCEWYVLPNLLLSLYYLVSTL
jgi:hypothetical protein